MAGTDDKDSILRELRGYHDDVQQAIRDCEHVDTSGPQDPQAIKDAASQLRALTRSLYAKSVAIQQLIADFIVTGDEQLVDEAKQLVADSKAEKAHHEDQIRFGDDLQDLDNGSDKAN